MLIAGAVIAIAGWAIFWHSWDQTRWQAIEGSVIDSRIERANSHVGGMSSRQEYWTLTVHYSYNVAGKRYESSIYSSSPPSSSARAGMAPSQELQRLLANYPAGRQVTVFVAPGNAQRVVLASPSSPIWIPLAVGLAVMAAAAIFQLRK